MTCMRISVPSVLIPGIICGHKQSGACTDLSLWPSAIRKVDFLGQSKCTLLFLLYIAEKRTTEEGVRVAGAHISSFCSYSLPSRS